MGMGCPTILWSGCSHRIDHKPTVNILMAIFRVVQDKKVGVALESHLLIPPEQLESPTHPTRL